MLVFASICNIVSAQNINVHGTVIDEANAEPIPSVMIEAQGTTYKALTDLYGKFTLNLPAGTYKFQFKHLTYETKTTNFTVNPAEPPQPWLISLSPKVIQTDSQVVVIGGKYDQRPEELTVTVELIRPNILENRGATSVDKAIEQAPGVAIVDNEPQVRGGSGFSSGLGSRIQVVIDDIPLLRADAGRPVWAFIPIENVEQIEVLKGASSVLYGSSALNGAVTIRTAYAKDKPETKIFASTGLYSRPQNRAMTPWEGFSPMQNMLSFVHTRRIHKNLDIVIGGNAFNDDGYIGPEPTNPLNANKRNEGEYERRARINFAIRKKHSKIEGLMYGVNGNAMVNHNAQAFFWLNADTALYNSYPGSITNFKDYMAYVDPFITYLTKAGNKNYIRNRVFYSSNLADNDQNTMSIQSYNEYQHVHKFKTVPDFHITAGVTSVYTFSRGQVFSGANGSQGSSFSYNLAGYAQFDKKFFGRLNVSAGGRYEYFNINQQTQLKPVFRAGANYSITEGTFVRASYGQGFRFPSIGERYINTRSGGFGFFPNPELLSENSWNSEVGIKQLFKINKFVGMADVVVFWQEYDNFVEFNAGLWGNSPNFADNIGFKFVNTGPARVTGIDFSVNAMGEIVPGLKLTVLAGYTYTNPITLNPDLIYAQTPQTPISQPQSLTYRNTSTIDDNVLKYRIQHLGKLDVEGQYKFLLVGVSTRYYSQMQNIDVFFEQFDQPNLLPGVPAWGITKYREENKDGIYVFDVRVGFNISTALRTSLIISNLTNNQYSLRPLMVEPPRVTTIQLTYKI